MALTEYQDEFFDVNNIIEELESEMTQIRTDLKSVVTVLQDVFYKDKPQDFVSDSCVADWVEICRSYVDAENGFSKTVDEIINELWHG